MTTTNRAHELYLKRARTAILYSILESTLREEVIVRIGWAERAGSWFGREVHLGWFLSRARHASQGRRDQRRGEPPKREPQSDVVVF